MLILNQNVKTVKIPGFVKNDVYRFMQDDAAAPYIFITNHLCLSKAAFRKDLSLDAGSTNRLCLYLLQLHRV